LLSPQVQSSIKKMNSSALRGTRISLSGEILDVIVDIPKERVKFFGGTGKMLLPSPATVAALIKKIPKRKLITTSLLCKELTDQFKVRGTCPVTTQKALQAIAREKNIAYWRVINSNGGLIARFPGGAAGQAALLVEEGFTIDTKGKVSKVKNFRESLWESTKVRMSKFEVRSKETGKV
jgi:alkylated DNA nucleotide flippase Atl1